MITRLKKSLTKIPASITEAATYLASIGMKQREINHLKKEASEKIAVIIQETDKHVSTLKVQRNTLFNALFTFATKYKATLDGERRSRNTPSGVFGWRWTTPYVDINVGKTDMDIIAYLERNKLSQYVRVVKEIDREALLRDRPIIPGVKYSRRDEFFAKPYLGKGNGRSEVLIKNLKVTEAIDVA